MQRARVVVRWLLALAMVGLGIYHFVSPADFVAIMPPYIPAHLFMVYASGVCEILGGIGLLVPRTRRLAGWGLLALLVAVFPANVHMAIHDLPFGDQPASAFALWARLPLQGVLMALVWWTMRDE
jgi:uncharacterized membrane protein